MSDKRDFMELKQNTKLREQGKFPLTKGAFVLKMYLQNMGIRITRDEAIAAIKKSKPVTVIVTGPYNKVTNIYDIRAVYNEIVREKTGFMLFDEDIKL